VADNLFSLEPLLITRIRDNMPELKTVGSSSLVSQKQDIVTLCDGVFFIPGAGDATANSRAVLIDQQWDVIVAVKHSYDQNDIETLAKKGGDICGQVIKLLHDWKPSTSNDSFDMRFAGHGNAYFGAGYGEFPLFFNVKSVFRGLLQ
jgi:hypothetical protein